MFQMGHLMIDTPALSPCPFCWSNRTPFEDYVSNTGGNIRFMRCQDCSAHGPWSTRSHSAQEKWNLRPAAAAPVMSALRAWLEFQSNDNAAELHRQAVLLFGLNVVHGDHDDE